VLFFSFFTLSFLSAAAVWRRLTTTGAAARRARRASLVAVRAEEPKGGLSRDSEPEE